MRNWYNMADGERATVSIYDGIGEFGVSAKSFLTDLRAVKASEVDLEINSPGGDVFAGIAIYNGLRGSGKKINVKVMGVAASAASLVAMAGDTIEMPENTFMMIHNPWTFAIGDADELRASADMLDKINTSLVSTYAKRSGKTDEDVTALLAAETWYTAAEAVAAGFADKVTPSIAAKARFDPDRVPENVKAVFALAQALKVEEAVESEPPFVEVLAQTVTEAGLSDFAAQWALDETIQNAADVSARIDYAKDVQALCKVVGAPDKAGAFIRASTPLATVRVALLEARANVDEQTPVNTVKKIGDDNPKGTQPAVVNTAAIWAAYRNLTKGVTK